MSYEWAKSLHLIAVISWMAGMLYLPRLFVYHAQAQEGSELSETLKLMEYRLLRYIMTPALIATWITGAFLITSVLPFFQRPPLWLEGKGLCVLAMTAVHGFLARCLRAFAQDRNQRSQRFFRFLNEVPTLLMLVIIFLVIFKPIRF